MNQSFGRAMSFVVSTLLLGAFVIFAQSKRQTLVLRFGTTSTSSSTTTTTSSSTLLEVPVRDAIGSQNTSATISNHTQTKHGNSMCLNKNDFKRNIEDHEQIFIVMPPKAGG